MSHGRIFSRACTVAGVLLGPGILYVTPASAQSPTFNIYGAAQADYIYDGNRVDPNWEDTLRPSKIPTANNATAFGSDGQSSVSVKQSRFGVNGIVPAGKALGDINFRFEFDLFGTGADAGQTTFRLRHAYAEWGHLLAGQTNSVFMDGDIYPNVIDYWGPNGAVNYRNVQIRYTPFRTDHSNIAFAIERPGNDIDVGTLRQLDPALGPHIQNSETLPDFTTHFYTSGSWGHFQLAGIVRRVGYDTIGTTDNAPKGSRTGWGVSTTGHLAVFDKDKLMAGVVYGEGIASYMNDGGVDLAPEGVFPAAVRPKAVPLLGAELYYDHYWDESWSSSIGYSLTRVDNTNLQGPSAYHDGQYASANLLYSPAARLLIGGEALWGQRTDFNGATGNDLRFQFSVKYGFSTTIGGDCRPARLPGTRVTRRRQRSLKPSSGRGLNRRGLRRKHKRRNVAHRELVHDACAMNFDGARRNIQMPGDFLARTALDDIFENLPFALRQ